MEGIEYPFNLLDRRLVKVITSLGYSRPTLIQKKAIPIVLSGVNTLIVSPTGTGKTEAALFPIYSRILELRDRGVSGGLKALYVTPLRALNRDILSRMEYIASLVGISIAVRHGDTPRSERRKIDEQPPDILITTPETLQFILVNKRLRQFLKSVRWVVVDELHELLDDKRGIQLSVALERLQRISHYSIQRIGLSATISSIGEAKNYLTGGRLCEVVVSDQMKRVDIRVCLPKTIPEDEILAEELQVSSDYASKLRYIVEAIRNVKAALIFTNTRDTAEALTSKLKQIIGDKVRVHHGSLSRSERVEVENAIKNGLIKAIVATSSLELGIDIGRVDLVIQYSSPRQAVKLLQRVGRSGHTELGVSRGVIVTLNTIDDILESAVLARRAANYELESHTIPSKPYDVLAHQIIGLLLERDGVTSINEIYDIIVDAYPYRDLTFDELRKVIEQLSTQGLVKLYGNGDTVKLGYGSIKYYFETSMIPDIRQYRVVDAITRRTIGYLDEDFVISTCSIGSLLILSGRVWKIISIDHENLKVNVEPTNSSAGILPSWTGEYIPVDYKVAREVGALKRLLLRVVQGDNKVYNLLKRNYNLDENSWCKILHVIGEHYKRGYPVPTDKDILVEKAGKLIIIHVHLGTKGNRGLSLLLKKIISCKLGVSVAVKSGAYHIVLLTAHPISIDSLKTVFDTLTSLGSEDLENTIVDLVRDTGFYLWRLINVAKRFGIISRDASVREFKAIAKTLNNTVIEEEAIKEIKVYDIDLNAICNLISLIKNGRVKIHYVESSNETLSPLSSEVLKTPQFIAFMDVTVSTPLILEMVKRRLENTRVKLVCLMCGKWSSIEKVGNLPDRIVCPKCNSGFIAVTKDIELNLENIVKKKLRKGKLVGEEKLVYEEARKSATLVLTYGKVAVIALAAKGIGPKTAAKIIGKLSLGETEFYKAIIEAERNYLKTRMFWRNT
ncbi:MAG TPA: DEAD/DEAH box helicase [Desulfurococcales archaeon]|nr:DEAD/DEAH box helicase [Desulfurococcales archaeon]